MNSFPKNRESGNTTSNEGASIPQMTQEISWADDLIPDSNSVSERVEELGMPEIVNLYESGLMRSPLLTENKSSQSVFKTLYCFGAMLMNPTEIIQSASTGAFTRVKSVAYQFGYVNQNFDSTCNGILYHIFSAAKEAKESYTFKEMARQDYCDEFVVAMKKEIDNHTTKNH